MRPHLRIAVSALVVVLAAATSFAQPGPAEPPHPPPERVLIPVFTPDPIPGLNGSAWATELSITNQGMVPANVYGVAWDCMLPECGFVPATVEPGRTFQPHLLEEARSLHGEILTLESETQADVRFGLRFRDLSRQASTWGTELPVPREEDFRTRFSLIGVPVEDGFRQTLRIYSLEPFEAADKVIVTVYRLDPAADQPSGMADALLGTSTLTLAYQPLSGSTSRPPRLRRGDGPVGARAARRCAEAPARDSTRHVRTAPVGVPDGDSQRQPARDGDHAAVSGG